MEADFLREYGLDVAAEVWIRGMTWRRFAALVAGLSANSTLLAVVRNAPLRDPDQIIAVLDGALGLE